MTENNMTDTTLPDTTLPETTPRGRQPGDLTREELVDRILRVDHAGELGAVRIYQGQLLVLGRRQAGAVIREMAEAEREHFSSFSKLIPERRARPSLLQPLWSVAGFALGVATAAMGPRAAMACTVAVEEVIDEHYSKQVAQLGDDEAELRDLCERYRQEEVQHEETARANGAEEAPGFAVLSRVIKGGSRAAIWLAERL